MPHEVIMPMLGMAQDSGKLIAWLKEPGDPVASGEILFEVETDKSVSEVEAQASGFLSRVIAQAGADVPVGQVIGIIGDSPEDTDYTPSPPAPTLAETPPPETCVRTSPIPTSPPAASDRILSSPLARVQARREGLDLADLAAMNHPQPYHVADLQILRDRTQSGTDAIGAAPAISQIAARVPATGVADVLTWMQDAGNIPLAPATFWPGLAASAVRGTRASSTDVIVELAPLTGASVFLLNPDLHRLTAPGAEVDGRAPDLILRDLTESRLSFARLGALAAPTLCLSMDRGDYVVTLDFTAAHFSDADAIATLTAFAKQLADPLLFLV